MQQRELEEVE